MNDIKLFRMSGKQTEEISGTAVALIEVPPDLDGAEFGDPARYPFPYQRIQYRPQARWAHRVLSREIMALLEIKGNPKTVEKPITKCYL
jgi:hypothetical protein